MLKFYLFNQLCDCIYTVFLAQVKDKMLYAATKATVRKNFSATIDDDMNTNDKVSTGWGMGQCYCRFDRLDIIMNIVSTN